MALEFPIDEGYLIGAWCSSALWGVFTVLFCYSMWFIFGARADGRSRNKVTTMAVILLYLLATVQLGMALRRLIEAFMHNRGFVDSIPASIIYMADVSLPLGKVKDLIYITTLVVGDSVVVWRCYMVWNRSIAATLLPIVLLLGTAVAGYGCMARYFLPHNEIWIAFTVKWATAMFAVSLSLNAVVTVLTAGRIWWLTRSEFGVSAWSRRRYRNVMLLITESGAVITISKLIEFSMFMAIPGNGTSGNNSFYIVFECMPQIMGIVPTMIVAAVNAQLTFTETHTDTISVLPRSRSIAFARRRPRTTVSDTLQDVSSFTLAPMTFDEPVHDAKTSRRQEIEVDLGERAKERERDFEP